MMSRPTSAASREGYVDRAGKHSAANRLMRGRGGDSTFSYDGQWSQDGGKFRAAISARRVVPGPPGVFGMDEIDIAVSVDGGSVSCTGFAKQSPGLKLDIVLMRMGDE